jgi:hypothetical protein
MGGVFCDKIDVGFNNKCRVDTRDNNWDIATSLLDEYWAYADHIIFVLSGVDTRVPDAVVARYCINRKLLFVFG